jgi:hypothetical protein
MSLDERRRHRRYPLQLPVKLHQGNEELEAHIVNASSSGCLLTLSVPLEPGVTLEASIPELMVPRSRLHILRCQSTPTGYIVAACFDAPVVDEPSTTFFSDGPQAPAPVKLRWLN